MKVDVIGDAQDHITEDAVGQSATNLVVAGSVLVVVRSGILQHTLPVAVTVREVALNQDLKAVKPFSNVRADYLALALRAFERAILHTCSKTGTTVQSLNLPAFLEFEIPLPPLDEQQRIVAEIEKQFARLDAAMAALNRVQPNLRRYRAVVLKTACEGRLVPSETEAKPKSNAAIETGKELLNRILQSRDSRLAERNRCKAPIMPDETHPVTLRDGWALASVDQLTSHLTSGSRDWSQFYGRGDSTFILAQNVRPMRLTFTDRQRVAPPAGDAETDRTRVVVDDLIVTIVGARTGDVSRLRTEQGDHFVSQSVALLRPVLSECAPFMEIYLASPENGQKQWRRYIYGQGRPHLSFEQLRMTAIPVPPLAEQHRIVAEVERRLSVIDELEAAVGANLQRAIRLRQSILQRAFSGNL